MSLRQRVVILVAVVVVSAGSGLAYVLNQRAQQQEVAQSAPAVLTADLAAVRAEPHIIFRSTALGPTYGKVAAVTLADPSGPRAVTGTDCERVYAAAKRVLCLAADRGIVTTYSAKVLDEAFREVRPLDLSGIASRARLSRDGSLAATTTFVSGHSYASTSFSTQTLVSEVDSSSSSNVEDFALVHQGKRIKPTDLNVWGVTFADDDTFYATVAWGGKTWLSRGSLSQRRLETIRQDAECPSLSPDRGKVVYKKRLGQPAGQWRLASYDLSTRKETLLAEPRSVDDQVEWLDDSTVMYGLPRPGTEAAVTDVWSLPIDGDGTATRLIAGAWSSAVVR